MVDRSKLGVACIGGLHAFGDRFVGSVVAELPKLTTGYQFMWISGNALVSDNTIDLAVL